MIFENAPTDIVPMAVLSGNVDGGTAGGCRRAAAHLLGGAAGEEGVDQPLVRRQRRSLRKGLRLLPPAKEHICDVCCRRDGADAAAKGRSCSLVEPVSWQPPASSISSRRISISKGSVCGEGRWLQRCGASHRLEAGVTSALEARLHRVQVQLRVLQPLRLRPQRQPLGYGASLTAPPS